MVITMVKKGQISVVITVVKKGQLGWLSGNVCKSGPLHFGSEKSFPSNFAQETILGHK